MATLAEVAQVAVEARRDKRVRVGEACAGSSASCGKHRVLSGLTPEKATSLLEDFGADVREDGTDRGEPQRRHPARVRRRVQAAARRR